MNSEWEEAKAPVYAIQNEDSHGSLSPSMLFRVRIDVEAWAPYSICHSEWGFMWKLEPRYMLFRMRIHVEAWAPVYAIQSEDWCGSFILSPVYAIQNEDWCGSLSPGICYCSVYVNHAVYPYHTLNKFYTVHAHNNHAFTFCQSACLSEINVCIHFQN